MEITRVSSQGSETLEEFYEDGMLRGGLVQGKKSSAMLKLLDHLCHHVAGPRLFGVTSHFSLNLVSDDDDYLPTIVHIDAQHVFVDDDNYGYYIAYSMRPEDAPWPDAKVSGYARDVQTAGVMISEALKRSAHGPT